MEHPSPTEQEDHKSTQSWLITFTDLVSLMLTFFVLLFAMSNVQVGQWKNVIDSLSRSLSPALNQKTAQATANFNIGTIFRKRAIDLDYLDAVLQEHLNNDKLLQDAKLILLDDRLIVALPGDLLFPPDSAVMKPKALAAMFSLGGIFRNIGNQIAVNGHTDPTPPAGKVYTSNWELSMARAAAVTNALRRAGYEDNIIAFGYAASQYGQLPKLGKAARHALARRVDIVVLPTVGGR